MAFPGLLTIVQKSKLPVFDDVLRDIIGIVTGTLCRFHITDDSAAFAMGWNHRQRWQASLAKGGGQIARLAMLPVSVKRELWLRLRPVFGFEAAESDNPELEKRIADLEAERDREAKEREAMQKRLNELDDFVRRQFQPVSPQQPHEERKTA